MKNKLKQLLNSFVEMKDSNETESDDIKIATSVLFLEVAYADFNVAPEEEDHIQSSLQKFFGLSEKEVDDLITLSKENRDQRNDIWVFTNSVKENFSKEAKTEILESLWGLVFADGHMDKYEEALMRKITTLMGMSHGEMIQAKLKAKNK